MNRLSGKVAFLTGGGAGIAKCSALQFVQEGAKSPSSTSTPKSAIAPSRTYVTPAAKGGIMSFTKTLAAHYAQPNIRANAVGPGSIRTERHIKRYENKDWMFNEKPTGAVKERRVAQKLYPFSVGDPIDIANIVVFLGTDESRMLTGTTIAADGGAVFLPQSVCG